MIIDSELWSEYTISVFVTMVLTPCISLVGLSLVYIKLKGFVPELDLSDLNKSNEYD